MPSSALRQLPAELHEQLRPEAVPRWRAPCLATLTERRFSDPDWIFERKFDGVRCLAFRDGDEVRLLSRNQKPAEAHYPELVDALAGQRSTEFVIDGEVVAFEGRRTSFSRLQPRMQLSRPEAARATGIAVFFYVFDVLHLDGYSTVDLPLTARKKLLRAFVDVADPVRLTPHRIGAGEEAYRKACQRGDEGVIAKRAAARYRSGRSPDWLKFKCVRDQEFVIGGYTAPQGSRVGIGALLVGYYDGAKFVYAGKVGTGFDAAMLRNLQARLEPLRQDDPPFAEGLDRRTAASWVQPKLVAQIGFTEWTGAGRLRHPRFTGLRDDKDPAQVVRETR